MKIYIAARAQSRTDDVQKIQKELTSMGHTITYDWAISNRSVKKPYREPANRIQNAKVAAKMLEAAAEADVLILLDEPGMRGAYVEMGAFLADALKRPKNRRVYVVGPDSENREHIFESPEYVEFCANVDEVFADLAK